MEINSVKIPLPQVVIAIIVVGGWMYQMGGMTKSFEKEDEKVQAIKKEITDIKEYITTITQYLNGEDDGVRGDFGAADQSIKEYEQIRSERDELKLKLWFWETQHKCE